MSGYGGLGGSEGRGGVPAGGHGYYGTPGRADDISDELKRTRGPRRPVDWDGTGGSSGVATDGRTDEE
jgi:hypothetical protein